MDYLAKKIIVSLCVVFAPLATTFSARTLAGGQSESTSEAPIKPPKAYGWYWFRKANPEQNLKDMRKIATTRSVPGGSTPDAVKAIEARLQDLQFTADQLDRILFGRDALRKRLEVLRKYYADYALIELANSLRGYALIHEVVSFESQNGIGDEFVTFPGAPITPEFIRRKANELRSSNPKLFPDKNSFDLLVTKFIKDFENSESFKLPTFPVTTAEIIPPPPQVEKDATWASDPTSVNDSVYEIDGVKALQKEILREAADLEKIETQEAKRAIDFSIYKANAEWLNGRLERLIAPSPDLRRFIASADRLSDAQARKKLADLKPKADEPFELEDARERIYKSVALLNRDRVLPKSLERNRSAEEDFRRQQGLLAWAQNEAAKRYKAAEGLNQKLLQRIVPTCKAMVSGLSRREKGSREFLTRPLFWLLLASTTGGISASYKIYRDGISNLYFWAHDLQYSDEEKQAIAHRRRVLEWLGELANSQDAVSFFRQYYATAYANFDDEALGIELDFILGERKNLEPQPNDWANFKKTYSRDPTKYDDAFANYFKEAKQLDEFLEAAVKRAGPRMDGRQDNTSRLAQVIRLMRDPDYSLEKLIQERGQKKALLSTPAPAYTGAGGQTTPLQKKPELQNPNQP